MTPVSLRRRDTVVRDTGVPTILVISWSVIFRSLIAVRTNSLLLWSDVCQGAPGHLGHRASVSMVMSLVVFKMVL